LLYGSLLGANLSRCYSFYNGPLGMEGLVILIGIAAIWWISLYYK